MVSEWLLGSVVTSCGGGGGGGGRIGYPAMMVADDEGHG
jgi:hypothetical protein